MPEYYDYEDAILARQEALEIWEDQDPLEDDLDDFLREIYADTGYDDQDLEGMLEEWEEDNAENDN